LTKLCNFAYFDLGAKPMQQMKISTYKKH